LQVAILGVVNAPPCETISPVDRRFSQAKAGIGRRAISNYSLAAAGASCPNMSAI
jgi:hypothetical protein